MSIINTVLLWATLIDCEATCFCSCVQYVNVIGVCKDNQYTRILEVHINDQMQRAVYIVCALKSSSLLL